MINIAKIALPALVFGGIKTDTILKNIHSMLANIALPAQVFGGIEINTILTNIANILNRANRLLPALVIWVYVKCQGWVYPNTSSIFSNRSKANNKTPIIPDICHESHENSRVNFFWPV